MTADLDTLVASVLGKNAGLVVIKSQDDGDTDSARIDEIRLRLVKGSEILKVPRLPPAVWGHGEEVLWAEGQSLIIFGPDGVGKTTLAGNLIRARLGLDSCVLGQPVAPGSKNVLVLCMDRPQQAMSAMARLFTGADEEILATRLAVWKGPPLADMAADTTLLLDYAKAASADTIVVDSIKDAAIGLSKDEVGAGWNRARQNALVNGVQLLELHHPRKAQVGNKVPDQLDDMFGSAWIFRGAGSVIVLWGNAGDPIVSLSHVKPCVTPVGPWSVLIDGVSGEVSITGQVDLAGQIALRGSEGITAIVAARLLFGADEPDRNEVEKARRKLVKLTSEGKLVQTGGHRGGTAGAGVAVWHAGTHASQNGQYL